MNKKVTIESFVKNSSDPETKTLMCQKCAIRFKIQNIFMLPMGGPWFKAYCSNCWDNEMNRRQMVDMPSEIGVKSE